MTRRPTSIALLGATSILAITVLASCTSAPASDPGEAPGESSTGSPAPSSAPEESAPQAPQTVAQGLDAPWSIVFSDGTPLVSERDSGRVLELAADGTAREVGTIDGVVSEGESGLLGLALDDQNRLYSYSTGSTGNRIQRQDLTGAPGAFALGPAVTIVDDIPAASYHDGGRLAFGPDGMLYATVGDAGRSRAAQDLDSPSGKILRMTADGGVPSDNPYPDSLVYSSGHRNPQGLAWSDDGTMFATEFGQDTWDELNIITPGGNYGWPTVEGIAGSDGFIDPVQQWTPDDASPSGMTYADGTLYIANLRGQVLRTVSTDDPTTATDLYSGEYGRIRDVALAPDGRLWFATSNTDGRGQPASDDDRIIGVDLG